MAMSRALGAAFLNHQVEQLEKSVTNGTASGNWRDRRQPQTNSYTQGPLDVAKRRPQSPGIKTAPVNRKRNGEIQVMTRDRAPARDREGDKNAVRDSASRRGSSKEDRDGKDADIVVVDASVLVHALYQVKKWCRDGREEVVIVPLEGAALRPITIGFCAFTIHTLQL